MWKSFILLICFSCTDLILHDTTEYHSIQLNGNAWIHIINDSNDENDISIMNNAFTLEFWFTGGNSGNSESACLASIIDASQTVFEDRNNIGKGKTWYYQIEVHNQYGRTSESNIESGKSKP